MTDRAVEVLSRAECLELLSHAAIGRVGVSIDALPVILPVHFALFGDSVLFRTVPGTKFDAAAVGAVLAFQADSYEPESPTAAASNFVPGTVRNSTESPKRAKCTARMTGSASMLTPTRPIAA